MRASAWQGLAAACGRLMIGWHRCAQVLLTYDNLTDHGQVRSVGMLC